MYNHKLEENMPAQYLHISCNTEGVARLKSALNSKPSSLTLTLSGGEVHCGYLIAVILRDSNIPIRFIHCSSAGVYAFFLVKKKYRYIFDFTSLWIHSSELETNNSHCPDQLVIEAKDLKHSNQILSKFVSLSCKDMPKHVFSHKCKGAYLYTKDLIKYGMVDTSNLIAFN